MELVYQIMMGVSLSACAGFRAWVPLLVMGIMARTGHIQLNASMQFLASDPMLVIFGLASVIEFCGDKFIAVDHFLDAVGTVARPIAGTILVSSMVTKMDGPTTLMLGLMAGGGTAMTMHAGKALVRAKTTAFAMLHGGAGNAALSVGEDVVSGSLSLLAIFFPFIAFVCAMLMLGVAALMIVLAYHTAKKVHAKFFKKPATARTSPDAIPAEVQS